MRLGQFISVASGFFPSVPPTPPTPPVAGAWDLTYAAFNGGGIDVFYPAGTWPTKGAFKPDGTKLYTVDRFFDTVTQYDLSTAGDMSTAVFVSTFSVSSQVSNPVDIEFSRDGTKMYMADNVSKLIYQYDLSTAWELSTASYSTKTFAAQFNTPDSISFKSDGTEVTVFDLINTRYLLSTPWDLSTATFDGTVGTTGGIYPSFSYIYAVSFSPNGLKMYNLINSSLEEYDLGTAWDIGTASYVRSFSLSSQGYSHYGLYFRSDGLKFYTVEYANDNVYEYDLTTAWDLSTASYSTKSFSVAAQESRPEGLFFKPDGLKMYIVGTAADTVFEYDLSTAWDVSTASYNSKSFSVSAQEPSPQGVFFKPDGTMMFITGTVYDDVYAYTLSTAWDVTTASFSTSQPVGLSPTGNPYDLFFDPTGTYLYMPEVGTGVLGYSLSTPWDISTISLDITGLYVKPFGSYAKMTDDGNYVIANSGNYFYRYPLSTAWDITTSGSSGSGTVLGVINTADAFVIYSDGNRLIRTATISDPVFTGYTMTGGDWNVTTALVDGPTSNYFPVGSQEIYPQDVFLKEDGLKMYVTGESGDDINEYDLTTAWDVTTATFLQSASVSTYERAPWSLFFKPDGSKVYILGYFGEDVNEFDLSTPWDVSTITFVQAYLVDTTTPEGVFFRSDGLRMYVCGGTGSDGKVMQYTLSTAWDVATAVETYSLSLWFSPYTYTYPGGIWFKPDGTKMFITHERNGVSEWDLTTPWDISTATVAVSFDTSPYMAGEPTGLFFKPDGTQFALLDFALDAVYTFDVRE